MLASKCNSFELINNGKKTLIFFVNNIIRVLKPMNFIFSFRYVCCFFDITKKHQSISRATHLGKA